MGGMGEKGKKSMYDYIKDQEFLGKLNRTCSDIVNQLVQEINKESVMKVKMELVGSGAKKLITQNANKPVDLDYNLCISKCKLKNERDIKEYIMEKYDIILDRKDWENCKDSTSVISTEYREFTEGNKTPFKIDLAIVKQENGSWYRLIHEKTGFVNQDRYYWNVAPKSQGLENKVKYLKKTNHWSDVRETYLSKKNMYLKRNDHDHPSFIVYIETINELYRKYK